MTLETSSCPWDSAKEHTERSHPGRSWKQKSSLYTGGEQPKLPGLPHDSDGCLQAAVSSKQSPISASALWAVAAPELRTPVPGGGLTMSSPTPAPLLSVPALLSQAPIYLSQAPSIPGSFYPRPGAHCVLTGPSTSPVCPSPFTAPAQPPNGGVDSSHVPGQQPSAPMSLQRQLGAHIGSDNSERWVQGDSVESRSDPWQGACTTNVQRH